MKGEINAKKNYNIPSNNRELQLVSVIGFLPPYYNIPSNNRELQPGRGCLHLRRIITYQVITGNYSLNLLFRLLYIL